MAGQTIAKAAQAAGVHVETIRYYERRGLLERPPSLGGYRTYPDEAVRRLRFVKRAQRLGFSLREIRGLLALRGGTSAAVRRKAEAKIEDLDRKLRELRAMRRALKALTKTCPGTGPADRCPILKSLDDETSS